MVDATLATKMRSVIGEVKEFIVDEDSWKNYFQKFCNWAELNEVDEKKLSRSLLAVMGKDTYNVLCTLLNGIDPEVLTLDQINQKFSKNFDPEPLEITESLRF